MAALAPVVLCVLTGCASMGGFTPPWKKADAKSPVGPEDSVVLTGGGGLQFSKIDSKDQQEFDAARRLFDEQKYAQAEPLFRKLVKFQSDARWWEFGPLAPADEKGAKGKTLRRGSDPLCEAALYYEAECQRMQKNYRGAVETYTKLLAEFRNSEYTVRTCEGLFKIADHWLEPTRRQMDEYQEQLQGKRTFVMPAMYFHWDKDMPTMDAEGHATAILNTVRLHNIKGPMAEKALLYLGTISFFRKDYKEADFYFTQLYQQHPNSDSAAKAVKQSVICKQLVTGGAVYDLRPVEESKKLLMQMQGAYPELAREKEWVEKQLISMNVQQAERDFKIAEFYQRTGHPGAAYFCFELVCRRYPGTQFAEKAHQRKTELKSKAERDQPTREAPQAGEPGPDLAPGAPRGPGGMPPGMPPPGSLPPGFGPGRDR